MTDQDGVPGWVIAILKWMLMLGALGGIVYVVVPQALELVSGAVEFGAGDDPDELAEETTDENEEEEQEEPEPVTGTAMIVDQLAGRSGATVASEAEAVDLGVGPEYAEELYLAFEPIPVDYPCLTRVTLHVLTTETDPTRIYAQPAQLTDLDSYTDGDPLPADSLIVGGGQVSAVSDGSPGMLAWDITEPYRVAATSVGEDDPVVIALLPDEEESGDPEVEFRSVMNATGVGDEQLARLDWSATPTCPGGTAPDADDEDDEDDEDDGADEA